MKKINFILFALLFILGCNQKNDDIIKVGVILPLSGPAAEIGKTILDGIHLAFDDFQTTSRKIELIIEDDKLDPKTGINSANKLIHIDKVKIIIGLASSPVALAVAPICEKNNVIMISSTASSPKLTGSGDYIFRIYPSDIYDGKILADFGYNNLDAKTSSILFLNNDFGVGLRDSFKKNFESNGGLVTEMESFLSEDISFRTQLTRIKESNSDIVLAIAIDMQYENIIKQIRELNIKSKILAPVTFDNPEIVKNLGNSVNGVYYTRPLYDINSSNKIVSIFRKSYKDKFNSEPPLLSAMGYDSFFVIFRSLVQNNYDLSLIQGYLYKTSFSGSTGEFKFDKMGDVIRDIEVMEIRKNKAVKYEK